VTTSTRTTARPEGEDIVLAGTWAGGGTAVRNATAERGRQLADADTPFDRSVDAAESADIISTFLTRAPALADASVRRGYADLYDMSPDDLPLIGPLPGIEGLVVVAGSSGHGFKTGPAIGEAIARSIVDGADEMLTPFDPARFLSS
jgi:glycine/D-amino acid oxidase-like deaminating enzyme